MSWIEDVVDYMEAQGLGTKASDLFYANEPDSDDESLDDIVTVLQITSPEPDKDLPTQEPAFTCRVRSSDYDTGEAKCQSIRSVLHRAAAVDSGDTHFFFILLFTEPRHIGRDDQGRHIFEIDFRARIR